MPTTYAPSDMFKEGSEKDWPAKLGGLDWDSTRIVFTKRTLIEFLRYTGTSVDPNLNNIAKLPRYADFGKLQEDGEAVVPGIFGQVPGTGVSGTSSSGDAFKPSRRVRTVPGGAQTFTLGDGSDEAFDTGPAENMKSLSISENQESKPEDTDKPSGIPEYKPSRRVRDGPGGPSTMANLWDEHGEAEKFKPTRRVREGPGGKDSISQIF